MATRTASTHSSRRPPLQGALIALAVAVPLIGLGAGCMPSEGGIEVDEGASLAETNGLANINGLRSKNGLQTHTGLTLTAGLNAAGGLSSNTGLMTTADGRLVVNYLVRCALPAGRSLLKADDHGNKHKFYGLIGLAPEWENGSCGRTCQEWITACMLSLVNTTGVHVPVWMMGEHPAVGFGQDPAYRRQEGSFFGNIFATDPQAYYCGGRDLLVNPVAGRIGSAQVDPPYTNIYGDGGLCAGHCTPSDYPHMADGYKACSGWNKVITIWHK